MTATMKILLACGLSFFAACQQGTKPFNPEEMKAPAPSATAREHDHQAVSAPATAHNSNVNVGVNQISAPTGVPAGMTYIPGGTFWMGCVDCSMPDTLPQHAVTVDAFWMDKTPVTNAEFVRFVKATGYKTIAEIAPSAADFPNAPKEMLVAGSACFTPPPQRISLDNPLAWWEYRKGANWRAPEGPGSSIKGRADHPAVHIAFDDAEAYAKWAGKRLPTEAEYEFASRGGQDRPGSGGRRSRRGSPDR